MVVMCLDKLIMLVHTYSLQLLSAKLVYFTDTTAHIRVAQTDILRFTSALSHCLYLTFLSIAMTLALHSVNDSAHLLSIHYAKLHETS